MSDEKNDQTPVTKITTTTGRQIVVGYDEYVNQRTGEVEEFAVMRARQADWNFEKIWLFKLIELLDLVGSAKVQVLSWMLNNRDGDNRVIATQAKIAEAVKVSRKTVNTLIVELKEEGLISVPQRGVYRLDPNLIWKGSHPKRMSILMQFEEEVEQGESVSVEEAQAAE